MPHHLSMLTCRHSHALRNQIHNERVITKSLMKENQKLRQRYGMVRQASVARKHADHILEIAKEQLKIQENLSTTLALIRQQHRYANGVYSTERSLSSTEPSYELWSPSSSESSSSSSSFTPQTRPSPLNIPGKSRTAYSAPPAPRMANGIGPGFQWQFDGPSDSEERHGSSLAPSDES